MRGILKLTTGLLIAQILLILLAFAITVTVEGLDALAAIYPILGVAFLVPVISASGIYMVVRKQPLPILIIIGIILNLLVLATLFVRYVIMSALLDIR